DLGVGGVEIHDVDLTRRERLVGDAMVEAARLLRQAVRALQARPAVAPAEELVRQAEAQLRMSREVGDLLDPEALGLLAAHPERIAVAETEGNARRQTEAVQLFVDGVQIEAVLRLQDLARDGAGVLRIDVDRPRLQRLEQDRGIAEPGLVRAMRGLRNDLAEDVGLGEALGANGQGLRANRNADR